MFRSPGCWSSHLYPEQLFRKLHCLSAKYHYRQACSLAITKVSNPSWRLLNFPLDGHWDHFTIFAEGGRNCKAHAFESSSMGWQLVFAGLGSFAAYLCFTGCVNQTPEIPGFLLEEATQESDRAPCSHFSTMSLEELFQITRLL